MGSLGDNVLRRNLIDYTKKFQSSNSDAMILLCKVNDPQRFGIAELDQNDSGKIKKIVEKPKVPPSDLAVIGIYFLTPKIFDIIDRLKPSWRGELEITEALQMLMDDGNKIEYDTVTGWWKDTGTPEDILNANMQVLKKMKPYFYGKKEDGVSVQNSLMLGEGSLIKTGSRINGPVIIGKNCIIEPNTTIGPNTSIGDHSVLSGCEVENSIIMSECKIECNAKIRHSIISTNSHISQNKKTNKEHVFLLGAGTKITL